MNSDLTKIIGQRVRNYRVIKKLIQEKLAELADCHPTYIGQVERGERNATIISIERIASGLGIELSTLFEKLPHSGEEMSTPLKCYEFLLEKTPAEQERLFKILTEIDEYKKK
ncbi:MAG: helix-turn-helix transcriptional regulator [Clostridia bacterium]|nr:helix-turn-helix transcriptional regulator [Clostridia bacterium]